MTTFLRRGFVVLRGLLYSAGFVWLWAWLAVSVRRLDRRIPVAFALPDWIRPLGMGLAVVGALLAGACVVTFVTLGRGTPAPFDPPRRFVASGPYRYVRNPMYVGAALVIVGIGLMWSSVATVLLAVAFLLVMHAFVVLHEEPALSDRFGDSYESYRSTVDRWRIRRPRAHGVGSRQEV